MIDDSPNSLDQPINLTQEEIRGIIEDHLKRGFENIAAEIVTVYGLEDEYPDLIAKVDADAAKLRNRNNPACISGDKRLF